MSQTPPSVLITGVIRNQEILIAILKQYVTLREAGGLGPIVFSTWRGEVEKVPGLRDLLAHIGVALIESSEPPMESEGHFFHQVKAARLGLELIPDQARVLKTRADLFFESGEQVLRLAGADLALDPQSPFRAPLRERIWIPFYEASIPFLISDAVLLGRACDLRRFYNANAEAELLGSTYAEDGMERLGSIGRLPPELRFTLPLFEETFGLLRHFRPLYCYLPQFPSARALALRSPVYWTFLAVYYLCLHHFFRVGRECVSGNIKFISRMGAADGRAYGLAPVMPRQTISPLSLGALFEPRSGTLHSDGPEFYQALLAGAERDSGLSGLFEQGLRAALAFQPPANFREQLRTLQEELLQAIRLDVERQRAAAAPSRNLSSELAER